MTSTAKNIVNKLWNLCHVLKDDGVTYHQYVVELTYLLFLKMAKETGTEDQIPLGYRWDNLKATPKLERLEVYKTALTQLGEGGSLIVREIFSNAITSIKKSNTFSLIIDGIDKIEWYNADREDLGNIYEGLLEKNANDKKSGAGQYFTTRALIDSIVSVMQPSLKDIIQDPAVGTGGFLIAANKYLREHDKPNTWSKAQLDKYQNNTFFGMEHVHDTHRLALMNLLLHGISNGSSVKGIRYGDTLTRDGQSLPKASLILSNPPFGNKKGGGLPERDDLPYPTSNKQFCFLQHIYQGLKVGGRAAVVLPDNALFEGSIGKQIRVDLMNKCNLHTILRLPTGIFYAQSVKTSVLFFNRGNSDKDNTKEVWVYDLRTNMPQYNKRNILLRKHFSEFEAVLGKNTFGSVKELSQRMDTGQNGRFRRFSREWIAERDNSLDISWLKEKSGIPVDVISEPTALAREAMEHLSGALDILRELMTELGEEVEV